MTPKLRSTPLLLLYTFISFFLFASFSLHQTRNIISGVESSSSQVTISYRSNNSRKINYAITEIHPPRNRHTTSLQHKTLDSVLFPDWELFILLHSNNQSNSNFTGEYSCLFTNNTTSPAKPTGVLPFSHLTSFKCLLPNTVRRRYNFLHPILTNSDEKLIVNDSESVKTFRWGFLTYESLSTNSDVILFVKGINNRREVNRSPSELRCLFGNNIKTAVTSSYQEVFRCLHPNATAIGELFPTGDEKVKVSIEIGDEKKKLVPSVAYYTPPWRIIGLEKEKSLLCACTMVYNVAKFLKEWVIYHSKIGIEKFILYDNGSDDELQKVIEELVSENYNVESFIWPWPKTQEGGFSHCAVNSKDSCSWMMFMDVDEFFFSPSWRNLPYPSNQMIKSLLPISISESKSTSLQQIGQIMVRCLEFGPSGQRKHPVEGVTQGYTCRRREEQRHKSIVLLDAVDTSLVNAVHHFKLKEGYRGKTLKLEEAFMNHYKYQAWPEFQSKFRRRVSAYVVDWRNEMNPNSKDRAPGLGFEAIEPKGWVSKFCEVEDNRLKNVTRRWFGLNLDSGFKMVWQSLDDKGEALVL